MKKLRYIAYARKSSEDDERQVLSIEAQKDKIKERFSGLSILDYFEESKSAFEPDKRPMFKQVLDMLDAGEVDGVVAWHPDRLSRNEVDASAITWRVRQNIIKDLRFANYSYDNSPEGMMMLQMTMSQSQYYSAKLSKDVKRGMEKKRQLGWLMGPAPEGYLNDKATKTVVKDPVRFPLLRKAFDMYLTGDYSVQDVLRVLNDDWGYKTVQWRKKGGGPLSRTSLYVIFRNVRYAGLIPETNDPEKFYKAEYPAMITMEEYDRVQTLLGRKGSPRLASRKQFALRGLLRCGECGCMITASSKKKLLKNGTMNTHTYYHCTGKRAGCTQKSVYVKEDDLYKDVASLLDKYELAPKLHDWAMDALRDMAEQEAEERSGVQAMQNMTIESTQKQLDKLLDMATRGLIDDATYKSKNEILRAELKRLQAEQAETAYRAAHWYDTLTHTFEKLNQANEKFTGGDLGHKKDILLAIGQNPVLLDGKVQINTFVWLEPVKENARLFRAQLEKVGTKQKQMKNASEEALSLQWRG